MKTGSCFSLFLCKHEDMKEVIISKFYLKDPPISVSLLKSMITKMACFSICLHTHNQRNLRCNIHSRSEWCLQHRNYFKRFAHQWKSIFSSSGTRFYMKCKNVDKEKGEVSASTSTASGAGLTGGITGRETTFTIESRDKAGNLQKSGGYKFKTTINGPRNTFTGFKIIHSRYSQQ